MENLIKTLTKKCGKLILDYLFFKQEESLQRKNVLGMMNNFLSDFVILPTRIKESSADLMGYGSSLGKFTFLSKNP